MKTYIVDSFTKEPFRGNPAGVCLLQNELGNEKMLAIAREFGLSETAFIQQTAKNNTYSIRYFSPKKEIALCGHATLASAKVIFKNTGVDEIHFITAENLDLPVKQRDEEIIMEFPIYDTIAATAPLSMLEALGLKEVIQTSYSSKNKILVLEINGTHLLANLHPDFNALVSSHNNINGVLVTARSEDLEYDYHYRYFWPWAGTDEDPVTGGVQTFLAKYWSTRLNKKIMNAFQSSSRTGYMKIELGTEKVLIISHAVIIFEGDLVVF